MTRKRAHNYRVRQIVGEGSRAKPKGSGKKATVSSRNTKAASRRRRPRLRRRVLSAEQASAVLEFFRLLHNERVYTVGSSVILRSGVVAKVVSVCERDDIRTDLRFEYRIKPVSASENRRLQHIRVKGASGRGLRATALAG